MIDRQHPAERVAAIVRDAGVATVILRRSEIKGGLLLPAGIRTIVIDDALEGLPAAEQSLAEWPSASLDASWRGQFHRLYVGQYPAKPKGIAISQRTILNRVGQLINAVHFRPDDKLLSLASPSTIAGLQHIFEALLTGAALVKLDLQRTGLGRVVQAIGEMGITMMFTTPAVWRSVARIDKVAPALTSLAASIPRATRCSRSISSSFGITVQRLPRAFFVWRHGSAGNPAMVRAAEVSDRRASRAGRISVAGIYRRLARRCWKGRAAGGAWRTRCQEFLDVARTLARRRCSPRGFSNRT